ncbi:MAG: hypothetical protein LIR40_14715 [Bacteroidota bacterium]|nr:hypothetical protein [Bacteroidota bacterium]
MVEKYLKLHLFYIVTIILCSFINGDSSTSSFWQGAIIGRFFTSTIYYMAVIAYCYKYSAVKLEHAILSIFVLNAAVTILQYFNHPIGWGISLLFRTEELAHQEYLDNAKDSAKILTGFAAAGGLSGFVVANGYYINTYCPQISNTVWNNSSISKLLGVLLIALSLFTAFATQERMAVFSIALYFIFVILFAFNGKHKVLACTLIAFCLYLYFSNPDFDYGRINFEQSNSTRLDLFDDFEKFASSEYLWFGGVENYNKVFGVGQHNTFLNAISFYGIFGSIPFFLLFFSVLLNCTKTLFSSLKKNNKLVASSASCLMYLLYSMTHSTGLQSGDATFWVIFGLYIYYSNRYKIQQPSNQSNYNETITMHSW